MLSQKQQQKIWQISDTVLYPEANEFLGGLMRNKGCHPLPIAQMNGLLNMAKGQRYSELEQFIKHQRDRTWPYAKSYIQTFYTELEWLFTTMRSKRIREEFRLLSPGLTIPQMQQQVNEIMMALAYDFIQHLEAENRLLEALERDQRRR